MTSSNRFSRLAVACLTLGLAVGCSGGTQTVSPPTTTAFSGGVVNNNNGNVDTTGMNIMSVTVNGSLCGDPSTQYPNQPCTSVTICTPGTSSCQTINNILLDTGSFGLRIFQSAITISPSPIYNGQTYLAECVQYGDGTSDWGQVETVDVKLGSEPAVTVPIEVINSTYATPPGPCTSAQSTPDISPAVAGYNGILGVGLFPNDCGDYCNQNATTQYYGCDGSVAGSTCYQAKVSLGYQVQNPVSLLSHDNNGVILQLPSVSASGATSVSGTLLLGIGTQANNTPSGVTTFPTDTSGNFQTIFSAYSGTAISGFIDSGSSLLYIPQPSNNSLPDCTTAAGGSHGDVLTQGYDCPSLAQSFTATNIGYSGTPSGDVSFQVDNAFNLLNSNNSVFINVAGDGGSGSNATFDWGLPFFFGRSVHVGISGTSSSLGTGPYLAY